MWNSEYYEYMKGVFTKKVKIEDKDKYLRMFDRLMRDDEFEAAKALRDVLCNISDEIKDLLNSHENL